MQKVSCKKVEVINTKNLSVDRTLDFGAKQEFIFQAEDPSWQSYMYGIRVESGKFKYFFEKWNDEMDGKNLPYIIGDEDFCDSIIIKNDNLPSFEDLKNAKGNGVILTKEGFVSFAKKGKDYNFICCKKNGNELIYDIRNKDGDTREVTIDLNDNKLIKNTITQKQEVLGTTYIQDLVSNQHYVIEKNNKKTDVEPSKVTSYGFLPKDLVHKKQKKEGKVGLITLVKEGEFWIKRDLEGLDRREIVIINETDILASKPQIKSLSAPIPGGSLENKKEISIYDLINKREDGSNQVEFIISTHGGKDGSISDEDGRIKKKMNEVADTILAYNLRNNTKTGVAIDRLKIDATMCYGAAAFEKVGALYDFASELAKEGVEVRISACDKTVTTNTSTGNGKNQIPTPNAKGEYVVREILFYSNETSLNQFISEKAYQNLEVKDGYVAGDKIYKTLEDFYKDEYVGKEDKNNKKIESVFKAEVEKLRDDAKNYSKLHEQLKSEMNGDNYKSDIIKERLNYRLEKEVSPNLEELINYTKEGQSKLIEFEKKFQALFSSINIDYKDLSEKIKDKNYLEHDKLKNEFDKVVDDWSKLSSKIEKRGDGYNELLKDLENKSKIFKGAVSNKNQILKSLEDENKSIKDRAKQTKELIFALDNPEDYIIDEQLIDDAKNYLKGLDQRNADKILEEYKKKYPDFKGLYSEFLKELLELSEGRKELEEQLSSQIDIALEKINNQEEILEEEIEISFNTEPEISEIATSDKLSEIAISEESTKNNINLAFFGSGVDKLPEAPEAFDKENHILFSSKIGSRDFTTYNKSSLDSKVKKEYQNLKEKLLNENCDSITISAHSDGAIHAFAVLASISKEGNEEEIKTIFSKIQNINLVNPLLSETGKHVTSTFESFFLKAKKFFTGNLGEDPSVEGYMKEISNNLKDKGIKLINSSLNFDVYKAKDDERVIISEHDIDSMKKSLSNAYNNPNVALHDYKGRHQDGCKLGYSPDDKKCPIALCNEEEKKPSVRSDLQESSKDHLGVVPSTTVSMPAAEQLNYHPHDENHSL